jgi:hypothetical protein
MVHLLVLVEFVLFSMCGQGSSVVIATHYRLDGPGIESLWGRDFLHPSSPALGGTQTPIQGALILSQG